MDRLVERRQWDRGHSARLSPRLALYPILVQSQNLDPSLTLVAMAAVSAHMLPVMPSAASAASCHSCAWNRLGRVSHGKHEQISNRQWPVQQPAPCPCSPRAALLPAHPLTAAHSRLYPAALEAMPISRTRRGPSRLCRSSRSNTRPATIALRWGTWRREGGLRVSNREGGLDGGLDGPTNCRACGLVHVPTLTHLAGSNQSNALSSSHPHPLPSPSPPRPHMLPATLAVEAMACSWLWVRE